MNDSGRLGIQALYHGEGLRLYARTAGRTCGEKQIIIFASRLGRLSFACRASGITLASKSPTATRKPMPESWCWNSLKLHIRTKIRRQGIEKVVHEDIEVGTKAVGSWRHDLYLFLFAQPPGLFCAFARRPWRTKE